jgi:hypothetical protein
VRRARPYERDLAAVLEELAEEFPLLQNLVERHAGGQKRFPVGGAGLETGLLPAGTAVPREPAPDLEGPQSPPAPSPPAPPAGGPSQLARTPTIDLAAAGRRGRSKPARLGLKLQFEARPESGEPGRLAENIVWINESHPAYRRAAASRSEGYHIAFAAAMALSTVAVEPGEQRAFVNKFLAGWGEAVSRPARRPPRSKRDRFEKRAESAP